MATGAPRLIIVATDLTERSDDVVRAGGALAALSGGRLHVLHALQLSESPAPVERAEPATFEGRIAYAERLLDEQVRRAVPERGSETTSQVVIRSPSRAILEQAAGLGADLIVVGPHRKHPLGDQLLGSTTDAVLKGAKVPCLVVRGPLTLPLRRIVVPDDLSEPEPRILELALRWGLSFGNIPQAGHPEVEIDVVHVISDVLERTALPLADAELRPVLDQRTETALGHVSGGRDLELRKEILAGDSPADVIVAFARAQGVDLIALGTHGPGAIPRLLLGSVASSVARRADCPVLLVPLKHRDSVYGFGITVALPYEEAVARTRQELSKEGFGVLCEIDVTSTLKNKLNVDFRRYVILGACNPPLAHRALTAELEIGLLLPCNVIVYAPDEAGKSVVAAMDPVVAMELTGNAQLREVAREVKARLERVIGRIGVPERQAGERGSGDE